METCVEAIEKFAGEIGIDLSKWKLEYEKQTHDYSDENECFELHYTCKIDSTYTIHTVLENFEGEEWVVVEFQLNGD
jgi:hypothetical protein